MKRQLLTESIRIDGETQSRERINEETVAEYTEAMKGATATPWPPVMVYFDGTDYWMADGFHRLLAAIRAGRKHIAAEVKQGSRADAAWAACAANQAHGLRRTNADKRKAVEMALKLHAEMSDDAIGRHVGVSREFVLRTRHGLGHQGVIGSHPEHRMGVDGKTYPVPPPRAKAPAAQGFGPPPSPAERRAAPAEPFDTAQGRPFDAAQDRPGVPPPPPSPPPAPAARKPDCPVDDMGRRIPADRVPLWNRRQEVQDMLTAISRTRVALRAAQDQADPLFRGTPYSSAISNLDQAYNSVQMVKPYAVCAFCQGHGCKACDDRGLLSKFRWDTAVPSEHKDAVARLIAKEQAS